MDVNAFSEGGMHRTNLSKRTYQLLGVDKRPRDPSMVFPNETCASLALRFLKLQ